MLVKDIVAVSISDADRTGTGRRATDDGRGPQAGHRFQVVMTRVEKPLCKRRSMTCQQTAPSDKARAIGVLSLFLWLLGSYSH